MILLNPIFSVRENIAELLQLQQGMEHRSASLETLRMLNLVLIP